MNDEEAGATPASSFVRGCWHEKLQVSPACSRALPAYEPAERYREIP